MVRERDYGSVRALMAKAIAAGAARPSMGHFEWDMSGDCESAKRMEHFARPPAPMVKGVVSYVNVPAKGRTPAKVVRALVRCNEPGATWMQPRGFTIDSMHGQRAKNRHQIAVFGPAGVGGTSEWTRPGRTSLWVTQIVRCGKCAACLRVRRRKWRTRLHIECKRSYRVWNGNIQLRPQQHYKVKLEAAHRYENDKKYPNRKAGDFDALPHTVRFACCHRIISEEITRWVKRIRHTTKSGVRICIVSEVHEGGGRNHGEPHYHVLIHQTEEAQITKAVLEDRWRWGFSHWRLVEEKAVNRTVGYLCKYLSKSMPSRIRASIGYGKTSSDIALAQGKGASEGCHARKGVNNLTLRCIHSLEGASAPSREANGAISNGVVGAIYETEQTSSGELSESQHHKLSSCPVQHPWRAAAAARLGGPGSINAFRKLAAKHNARLTEPQNANRIGHASLGHSLSARGPFDHPSDSGSNDGPLSDCVQAGQSSGSDVKPEE